MDSVALGLPVIVANVEREGRGAWAAGGGNIAAHQIVRDPGDLPLLRREGALHPAVPRDLVRDGRAERHPQRQAALRVRPEGQQRARRKDPCGPPREERRSHATNRHRRSTPPSAQARPESVANATTKITQPWV